ncbi:HD domain-containing protein [Brevundimonas sp. UBA5936]|uniref:HD domain-containing protein n=1 Tax=Brevundimonas sp. UBA5936 TaxID=1946133 RepID=UPI0025B9908A|nr:HD domain-containing protein [Brevundimonas sp. UBA5936]
MDTPDIRRIASVLQFLKDVEPLKDTLRTGRTSQGRQESTAEHCWRLALSAMLFAADRPDLDCRRLLELCLVHDLGEVVGGDVPAPLQVNDPDRAARERADLTTLVRTLPRDLADMILARWDEYADAMTPEALAAKALDKLETMTQHLAGRNAEDFDYSFNLSYGRVYTDSHPQTMAARSIVDGQMLARLGGGHVTASHRSNSPT